MEMPKRWPFLNGEARVSSLCQAGLKRFGSHVTGRFGKEQLAAGLKRAMNIFEQGGGIGDFVHHREGQREIDASGVVLNAKSLAAAEAGFNSFGQAGLGSAFFQSLEHSGLHIDREHPAFWSHTTRKFECEETHAGARLEDNHALGHEWSDDGTGWLEPSAHRAGQEISEPPWTDSMSDDGKVAREGMTSRGVEGRTTARVFGMQWSSGAASRRKSARRLAQSKTLLGWWSRGDSNP